MCFRKCAWNIAMGLLLQLLFLRSYAQTTQQNVSDSSSNEYVANYDHFLIYKMSVNSKISGFDIKNTTTYRLRSNNKTALNVGINYRWLAFNLNFYPKFFKENDDNGIKGKTKSFGFGFASNFGKVVQKINYQRIKGYYLDNTSEHDPSWKSGDPYILFPDLVYKGLSGQTGYKFNDKFSFNAINSQTEKQLKSAGTFLPSFFYQYYIVNDRTPLTGTNSSQKSKTLQIVFAPGYYYTFVTNHNLYFSAGLNPGIGYSTTKLITRLPSENVKTHYHGTVYQLETNVTLGFDSERFFTGLQVTAGTRGYGQSDANNVVLEDKGTGIFFIGYRFNAPRKLKNTMEKVEKMAADKLDEMKKQQPQH